LNKQQILLVASGASLLIILYFFGNSTPPSKKIAKGAEQSTSPAKNLDIQEILQASKSRLSPLRQAYVNKLENSVVRGDVKDQQIKVDQQLATFWKDSVKQSFLPYAYYVGQGAKLENSEKSLTFAAQLFFSNLRFQDNPSIKTWMANQAKELFERVLELNPNDDSAKIGLGGSYIFGGSADKPQQVMQGIQQILEVVRKDSTNMYAQFILALGGIESGQLDKAIDRLIKVVRSQPDNLDALLTLADAYERKGDKAGAISCYQISKKMISDQQMIKEIDQRIKSLE
jgi:tetratricopeptide (TPR) repeat protein